MVKILSNAQNRFIFNQGQSPGQTPWLTARSNPSLTKIPFSFLSQSPPFALLTAAVPSPATTATIEFSSTTTLPYDHRSRTSFASNDEWDAGFLLLPPSCRTHLGGRAAAGRLGGEPKAGQRLGGRASAVWRFSPGIGLSRSFVGPPGIKAHFPLFSSNWAKQR
ncbi:hypothetical protein Droror1_Dr00003019 [Drosera rotundifolia]